MYAELCLMLFKTAEISVILFRMDFIEKLPREISLHILSFLQPKDLVQGFSVSKTWHSLVNTDLLWKRHCLVEKINLDETPSHNKKPTTLCKWARVYRSFIRTIRKWDEDKPQYFTFTLTSSNFALAIGGVSLAVHYFSSVDETIEFLHFYRASEENVDCEEIVNLDLPGKGIAQLYTNDLYTIISRDNFILCLKKVGGKHINYRAVSLRSGLLEFTKENFSDFIISKRCVSRDLGIRELCDRWIWMEENNRNIIVFDIESTSHINIKSLHEIKFMNNLVAVWSNSSINIYSPNGEILQNILVDYVQDLCFNKNTVASLLPDTGQYFRQLLMFDLKTGEKLTEKVVMRFTDITLHPQNDSIFALERSSRDLYRVSSICARTGKTIWNVSLPNMYYNMWTATVKLVSYKHLFVWPSNNKSDKYSVFDCDSGKYLYVTNKVTGTIQWVSENLVVSTDAKTVYIKNFL